MQKKKKKRLMRKKYIGYLLAGFMTFFLLTVNVHANQITASEADRQIIFVVDHSGSMNVHDEKKAIPQILKTFIDTLSGENIEIGYVAYNDSIVSQQPLTSMQSKQGCQELKGLLDATQYQGETDIGLGLYEAYQMLRNSTGQKEIILLSDGETDLENSNTGRTKTDSDRDIREIVQKCQEEGISVSTIAFGGEIQEEELQEISKKTGGEEYFVQTPEELVKIYSNLLCNKLEYSVYEVGNSIYDEGSQKISYEYNRKFDELTVFLLSDKEIKNACISFGNQTVEVMEAQTEGEKYYVSAIVKDAEENIVINFDTVQTQKVAVYIIGKQEVIPVIDWPDAVAKNEPVNFQVQLWDKEQNLLTDAQYQEAFDGSVLLCNLQTGEVTEAEMKKTDSGLSGTVRLEHSGNYLLKLDAEENLLYGYEAEGITVLNTLPQSTSAQKIDLLLTEKAKTIDLNEYFRDADGDPLTFELQEVPDEIVTASLDGSFLKLVPAKRGNSEIKLVVSDKEGSLAGTISVRVRIFWEKYWQIPLLFLCIIGFCIGKLLRRNKKKILLPVPVAEKNESSFTGKLNAYFTLLPDEREEIPPLSFALHPIREKKIVLKDMFADYPDLIDLLELDNIYLFPEESRKMILYHDSSSTVMIGNSIVCRKMQYVVNYGNVIYITSKDGTCELEVHYISMI